MAAIRDRHELPENYVSTRAALHRVAAHVLGRARSVATGRFGLRATPGGFGTPVFGGGDGRGGAPTVLRVAGTVLVRETQDDDARVALHPIDGSSLAALAAFAGADLDAAFTVGRDTPPIGDAEAPLRVSSESAAVLAEWLHAGARALDRVTADLGDIATPTTVQLWPEHFDLACDVDAGLARVNLGVSTGDHFHDGPYAYVGPRTADRPGDPAFWNAPFGALVGRDALSGGASDATVDALVALFTRGVDRLRAAG
ncbi:MAG: hypothetical protein AMXMBFR46_24880 [Acidimicrobiia bacterium]